MGVRFSFDPIFWQKVLLGHQNKGLKMTPKSDGCYDPRKDAIF